MQNGYCPYCMSPAVPGQKCSGCGRDPAAYVPEPHHFPAGQLLAGRYYVGHALGEGGFGITYLGLDTKLKRRVAIKEYFPRTLVRRESSATLNVTCYTGSSSYFEKGREQFLQEAQTLAKMDDIPEIVHVLDFFPENNSAYIVMEFLEGTTLKELVAQRGMLPTRELLQLMEPVLKAMNSIHQEGLIHRDISPDNLMLMKKSGQVKLMDFGCAREIGMGHTMTVMLKPGFAPMEQSTGHEQGPWTDVYAICTTIYYCLTGVVPPEAVHRIGRDTLVPPSQLGMGIDPIQEQALMKGMSVYIQDRYKSVAELYRGLYGKDPSGVILPEKSEDTVGVTEFVVANASANTANRQNGYTEYISYSSAASYSTPKQEYTPVPPKQKKSLKLTLLPLLNKVKALSDHLALPQLSKRAKIATAAATGAVVLLGGFAWFWLAHPHSYGDWVTIKEATCMDSGTQERKCFCGETENRTLSAMGHTRVEDAAVAATCTAPGLTAGIHCSACNLVLVPQQSTQTIDHDIVYLDQVNPTCTETGLTSGYGCSVCGYSAAEREIIAALGHTEVTDKAVAATCSAEGKTEGSHCSACGEILVAQQTIEKTAHTVVTDKAVAATCSKEGKTEGSHCSVCSAVITAQKAVAKLAHTPVTDAAVEATCSKEGKTEGSHCSICGEVIVAQKAIEKLPHTVVIDQGIAATCTREGKTEGSHCSVCGNTIKAQTIIPAEPHNYSDGKCTVCSDLKPSMGLKYELVGDHYIVHRGSASGNIVIPATYKGKPVAEIGEDAFNDSGNWGVYSVTIAYGVQKIGDGAFFDCENLTCVSIPSSVIKIGKEAFGSCEALSSIELPPGLTKIEWGLFSDCKSLTSIEIPSSVTVIEGGAFNNTGLTAIVIPYGVTTIDHHAFADCASVESVTIPSSVKTIGKYAFAGCDSLTSIVIPFGVETIEEYAFSYCISLESIVIPSSVKTMGMCIFRWSAVSTVYCEASSQPSGWDAAWSQIDSNDSHIKNIVWGYTG